MPTVVHGNGATYPSSFLEPSDGDDANAASVGGGFQALADRTAYLAARAPEAGSFVLLDSGVALAVSAQNNATIGNAHIQVYSAPAARIVGAHVVAMNVSMSVGLGQTGALYSGAAFDYDAYFDAGGVKYYSSPADRVNVPFPGASGSANTIIEANALRFFRASVTPLFGATGVEIGIRCTGRTNTSHPAYRIADVRIAWQIFRLVG